MIIILCSPKLNFVISVWQDFISCSLKWRQAQYGDKKYAHFRTIFLRRMVEKLKSIRNCIHFSSEKFFFFFRLPWSRHILITCLEWLGAQFAFFKKIVHQYCHNIAMKFCCSIHATLKTTFEQVDAWIPILTEEQEKDEFPSRMKLFWVVFILKQMAHSSAFWISELNFNDLLRELESVDVKKITMLLQTASRTTQKS